MPMVAGDDRAAARSAASAFAPDRTAHFWDETRLVGRACSDRFVAENAADLRRAVSDLPELADRVEAWVAEPASQPAWDCALFFPSGVGWTEPFPEPLAWTKQFGYWETSDGSQNGGTFWSSRFTEALVDSSWSAEVEDGMQRITSAGADASAKEASLSSIEILGFAGCPNTAAVRRSLEDAVQSSGIDARVAYVDQEALPRGDPRRGWPAPTILVDGRDLFGMAAPEGGDVSCRMYAGGAPSASEIAAALRER